MGMGEPTLTERFAREVRAELGRRHLHASDISRATGIPESRLSRKLGIAKGGKKPELTLMEVQQIATFLDMEVSELMAAARSRCSAFFQIRDGTKQSLDELVAA